MVRMAISARANINTVLILGIVIISLVHHLGQLGATADMLRGGSAGGVAKPDAVLLLRANDVDGRFATECRDRTPYPNELKQLDTRREILSKYGEPLLIVPFVSKSLGERLRTAGWSWADSEGNLDLRSPGLVLRQRVSVTRTKLKRATQLPGGAGSSAAIRRLIRSPRNTPLATVTNLAAQVGVSQPRMSQILTSLSDLDLTVKKGREWFLTDREALLDQFVDGLDQPAAPTRYLYSLDPVSAVAERSALLTDTVVVSADVGPDLIAPWRQPSVVVLYSHDWIDPDRIGAVEAEGRDSSNVFVRQPSDNAVMASGATARLRNGGPAIPLADPTQMLADLIELGGSDRQEAAEVLRTWILERP